MAGAVGSSASLRLPELRALHPHRGLPNNHRSRGAPCPVPGSPHLPGGSKHRVSTARLRGTPRVLPPPRQSTGPVPRPRGLQDPRHCRGADPGHSAWPARPHPHNLSPTLPHRHHHTSVLPHVPEPSLPPSTPPLFSWTVPPHGPSPRHPTLPLARSAGPASPRHLWVQLRKPPGPSSEDPGVWGGICSGLSTTHLKCVLGRTENA